MWNSQPSGKEIAKWFSSFSLHSDTMQHSRYVGGVVAIKDKQSGVYRPYVNAATRIAYFWDYCDACELNGEISVSDPRSIEIPFGKENIARVWIQEARVTAYSSGNDDFDSKRSATAKKTVRQTITMRNGTVIPDIDGIAKAETGAIARALGILGMLTFPGSGVATAEDMLEFIAENQDDNQKKSKDIERKAPNPKNAG